MARRRGRPGNYLFTDDYSGFTVYASEVSIDYWGSYSKNILQRNLQEIASPLGDPYPVPLFSGSQYEQTTACQFEVSPLFIGKTHIPFTGGVDPGVGSATIGCTFRVH